MDNIHEYFLKYGFDNPGANPNNPSMFQFINNTDLEYFEWMTTNPDKSHLDNFNVSMAGSLEAERIDTGETFIDTFPFTQELADISPDEIAVVDVGGGYGHLLREFRTKYPHINAKVALEDLPETVAGAGGVVPGENTIIQPYNFFNEVQPIKGARFYILRHVLHDWPDHACRKILQNIAPALLKGKSKIFLVEVVLENQDTSAWGALMDINMMKFGGMGRKERQWRAVVESAGLKVVKIWPAVKEDRIIEIVPADW